MTQLFAEKTCQKHVMQVKWLTHSQLFQLSQAFRRLCNLVSAVLGFVLWLVHCSLEEQTRLEQTRHSLGLLHEGQLSARSVSHA